jgi:hypothetical protein
MCSSALGHSRPRRRFFLAVDVRLAPKSDQRSKADKRKPYSTIQLLLRASQYLLSPRKIEGLTSVLLLPRPDCSRLPARRSLRMTMSCGSSFRISGGSGTTLMSFGMRHALSGQMPAPCALQRTISAARKHCQCVGKRAFRNQTVENTWIVLRQ